MIRMDVGIVIRKEKGGGIFSHHSRVRSIVGVVILSGTGARTVFMLSIPTC